MWVVILINLKFSNLIIKVLGDISWKGRQTFVSVGTPNLQISKFRKFPNSQIPESPKLQISKSSSLQISKSSNLKIRPWLAPNITFHISKLWIVSHLSLWLRKPLYSPDSLKLNRRTFISFIMRDYHRGMFRWNMIVIQQCEECCKFFFIA